MPRNPKPDDVTRPEEPSTAPPQPYFFGALGAPNLAPGYMRRDDEQRARSGSVETSDPLVVFLYLLARSSLPTGPLEALLEETENARDRRASRS